MKRHVVVLSRPRMAGIFGDGSQLDPLLSLEFIIGLLEAIGELLGRKNPSGT